MILKEFRLKTNFVCKKRESVFIWEDEPSFDTGKWKYTIEKRDNPLLKVEVGRFNVLDILVQ